MLFNSLRRSFRPTCPSCGMKMTLISEDRRGFSMIKSLLGSRLIGQLGVSWGLAGRKVKTWRCTNCGFQKVRKTADRT